MKSKIVEFLRRYRFNSIIFQNFVKLFFVFIVILIIPVIIISNYTINSVYKEATNENKQRTQKLESACEVMFRDVEYMCAAIINEPDINMFVSLPLDNSLLKEQAENVTQTVGKYHKGRFNIFSVYVYSQKNGMVCTKDDAVPIDKFKDSMWLEDYDKGFESNMKVITRKIGSYPNVFTFIKKTDNALGAVVANVDISAFGKNIDNILDRRSTFYIIDGNTIIYSNNRSKIFSKIDDFAELEKIYDGTENKIIIDGKHFVVNNVRSKYYGWKYVSIMECKDYESRILYLYLFLFGTIFLFILFVSVATIMFSSTNLNLILSMVDLIDNKKSLKYLKDNEITYLANKIISIIDDNKKLHEEINSRINQYENLRLHSLQSQINSHFLNNTLNAINKEIVLKYGCNEPSSKMIIQLSRLLQYCFKGDEILVSFSKEIAFLEKYVQLLSLRYGEFHLELDTKDISDVKMMRLTLQPIIENSVFHGIKGKGDKGYIKVVGREKDGRIIVEVTDNGVGMTEEEIKKIYVSLNDMDSDTQNIGMKNIYKRLKMIYGENVTLEVVSRENEYTKVTIVVPKL